MRYEQRLFHPRAFCATAVALPALLGACGPTSPDTAGYEAYPPPGTDATPAQDTLQAKLDWVQTWGGPWGDGASDVAVTETAVYVAGHFISDINLDAGPGVVNSPDLLPSGHASLTKFDMAGKFVWNKTLPGTRFNDVPHVAVGPNDIVYVTSAFSGSADFDPGPGEDVRSASSDKALYLAAFTADGAYRFSRMWASTAPAGANPELSIAADGASVYVLGWIRSQSGPAQGQPFAMARLDAEGTEAWFAPLEATYATGLFAGGGKAACVTTSSTLVKDLRMFDTNGPLGTVTWSKGYVDPVAVAIDASGATYVAGTFSNGLAGAPVDLDPAASGQSKASAGWSDGFVMKLDASAKHVWSRTFGSKGADNVTRIKLLPDGGVAVAGSFFKTVDFGLGSAPDPHTAPASKSSTFVLEVDTDGSALGAYSFIARPDFVMIPAIAPNGALLVAGTFDTATNFATGCFGRTRVTQGHGDAVVLKLSKDAPPLTASGICAPDPMLPPRNQTDPRLASTHLPKNFDDCKQMGGVVYTEPTGDDGCELVISELQNQSLFDECSAVGGGVAVPAGEGGSSCSLQYPEYGTLCFGNLCD